MCITSYVKLYHLELYSLFRKLPIAFDRDINTSVGEAKGPNVMTGYEDGAMKRIVDSFLRSICS